MGSEVDPDAGYALIVNYLPPSFTDQDLYDLFADIGPLLSAKVMKNKHNGSSFGYGFVNFVSKEDAELAIKSKNDEQVLNKHIRVAFSRRAEGPEAIKNSNLFVGNLPHAWTQTDLEKTFKPFGKLIKTKVLFDKSGKSKGCGFLLYSKAIEADAAILAFNNKKLPGCEKPLVVKLNSVHEAAKATAFKGVASSSHAAREVHVIHHYSPYPMVHSGYVYDKCAPHPPPPPSSAFPDKFVQPYPPYGGYEHYVQQMPAYGYVHSHDKFGPFQRQAGTEPKNLTKPVDVSNCSHLASVPPNKNGHDHTLFVYNIGPECTELDLYKLFGPCGAVTKAHIQRDPATEKSRGFGFVEFSQREEAQKAIDNLNGVAWDKNDYRLLQVSFKKQK